MSTKIYSAYRLPAGTDMFDIVAPLRAVMIPARLAADADQICQLAVSQVDDFCLHRDLTQLPHRTGRDGTREPIYQPSWPWLSAIQSLAEDSHWEDSQSWMHDRHRFQVSILRDPADGRLLAMTFGGHSTHQEEAFARFVAEHGWEDWHYQNQTDKPDHVSDHDWQERQQSWDRALGNSSIAARSLSIDISLPNISPHVIGVGSDERAALEAVEVPTVQQRLRGMVRQHVFAQINLDDYAALELYGNFCRAQKIVEAAEQNPHPVYTELMALMHPLTVKSLHDASRKTPLISHDITADQLKAAALTLVVDLG